MILVGGDLTAVVKNDSINWSSLSWQSLKLNFEKITGEFNINFLGLCSTIKLLTCKLASLLTLTGDRLLEACIKVILTSLVSDSDSDD